MTAQHVLNQRQMMPVHELMDMYSADHDVPMHKVLPDMEAYHETGWGHKEDYQAGGVRQRINNLAADVKKNGVREPVTVRNGNVLKDGHHRVLAAHQAGLTHVPVEHIQ